MSLETLLPPNAFAHAPEPRPDPSPLLPVSPPLVFSPASVAAVLALSSTLAACGGGGGDSPAPAPLPSPAPAPSPSPAPPPAMPSRTQAARFLSQSSLSSTSAEASRVQSLGYSAWLDEQMALPRSSTHVEWLRSKGFDNVTYKNSQAGADNMLWRKLLSSPDPLRQRVTLALSEIVVVSIAGISNTPFRQFAAGAFMDILEANAFGNWRTLLEQVSTSVAMGGYLTFKGSKKANAASGSVPDENYARESMQLFSLGVALLNLDGTPKTGGNGQVLETYAQTDVSQMARVYTGWDFDTSVGTADTPDRVIRPMVQYATLHESGTKSFLGITIPANTDGVQSLKIAMDTLLAHPNIGPFISRQLIQRLVTSSPTPAYVARVAAAFNDNGSGVKGDLRAVLRAVFLDTEARSDAALSNPTFGKLREPLLRFVQWARTFGYADPAGDWRLGDLTDPATRLGQSPLRSPTVFNFFRPGYVPPNSSIGNRTAPEFQITTETSVAGYLNFMQSVISAGFVGLRADYSAWMPLVPDSAALLSELNAVLAAGQLPAVTLASLKSALDTISTGTATGLNNRLYAAVILIMASPEYVTLK